jgi:hypothetical protein
MPNADIMRKSVGFVPNLREIHRTLPSCRTRHTKSNGSGGGAHTGQL